MNIRKKIILYFSTVTIGLVGVSFLFIYTLFSEYRQEDFQKRQKDQITNTLRFLSEFREINQDLITDIDRITINEMYNEKLLIFNNERNLIYSSIDDTPVPASRKILYSLSKDNPWIEESDGLYDILGVYLERNGKAYYGICKAYDSFGYSKLSFLKYVLIFSFIGISMVIVFVAYYLSQKLTRSIVQVTGHIGNYQFTEPYQPLEITGQDEISVLAQRFNELMQKMNDALSFQRHTVHHISHELKTPLAILVSNLERMEKETDVKQLHRLIAYQKEDTLSLGGIINSLLELSKAGSEKIALDKSVRIDEMIFDLAASLTMLQPDFVFSIDYASGTADEKELTVKANERLLKAALSNLMVNCINYSNNGQAHILIHPYHNRLEISFSNKGSVITEKEKHFMFTHFFRGSNSQGKRGFGLGLVFVNKIVSLHGGTVSYHNPSASQNTFIVSLPLS